MKRIALLLTCLAAAGCSKDLTDGVADAGTPPPPDAAVCVGTTVYYLNSLGETFSPGTTDPVTNTTSIINGTDPVALSPSGVSPSNYLEITTCVNELIAPYNIRVTDMDPSPDPHQEVVLTSDNSSALGLSGGMHSISSFSCADFTNLAFVFSTDVLTTRLVCENIVFNMLRNAHVDNLFSCETLPTFLEGCGDKSIVDADAPCGEFDARACTCGGATINPHQAMLDQFGAACPE